MNVLDIAIIIITIGYILATTWAWTKITPTVDKKGGVIYLVIGIVYLTLPIIDRSSLPITIVATVAGLVSFFTSLRNFTGR